MREAFEEARSFGLKPGCVQCDEMGLSVGGSPLLQRTSRPGGGTDWRKRPADELEPVLTARYGAPISLATKGAGLDYVARSLNEGNVALAQVTTLLLQLPDPPPLAKLALPASRRLVAQLAASGLLARDWNPDEHPRTGTPPNPGWFAPKDDDSYEVAENDKETPQTMTDASPETAGGGAKETVDRPAAGGDPRSIKEQLRQPVRDLRQMLSQIGEQVIQTGSVVLWTSQIIVNQIDKSLAEIEFLMELPGLITEAEQVAAQKAQAEILAAEDPAKTLAELQTQPEQNIEGYDQHHLVNQNPENLLKDNSASTLAEKFGSSAINDPSNIVWVPRLKHQLITGYYNSRVRTESGYRLRRDIVGDGDWDSQYQNALETLRLYGVLK